MQYYNFKFLLKADDDSFVCLRRITSMLHDMDPAIHDRVYAGVPTYCNNPTNPDYWVRERCHAGGGERAGSRDFVCVHWVGVWRVLGFVLEAG